MRVRPTHVRVKRPVSIRPDECEIVHFGSIQQFHVAMSSVHCGLSPTPPLLLDDESALRELPVPGASAQMLRHAATDCAVVLAQLQRII